MCGHNPYNHQTKMLAKLQEKRRSGTVAGEADRNESSTERWESSTDGLDLALRAAIAAIDEAFYVGSIDHYAASMCLLQHKVGKPLSSWCGCDAGSQSDQRLKWQPHHTTHRTQTDTLQLTGNDLDTISRITRADAVVYAHGVERLRSDLADARLSCMLTHVSLPAEEQKAFSLAESV